MERLESIWEFPESYRYRSKSPPEGEVRPTDIPVPFGMEIE
jgi:hypothetical protein